MSLQGLVRQLAGTDLADEIHLAVATVKAVSVTSCTCTVEITGGKAVVIRSDVKLMATVDDGFFPVPSIDSQVIVAWSTRNKPYVAMFSQLQDVYLAADNKVTLQGDNFGGLVKVGNLVTRLNSVENLLNDLITKYNAHVHPDPVSGITGVPTILETNTATLTQVNDLENPKVVHGN